MPYARDYLTAMWRWWAGMWSRPIFNWGLFALAVAGIGAAIWCVTVLFDTLTGLNTTNFWRNALWAYAILQIVDWHLGALHVHRERRWQNYLNSEEGNDW